MPDQLTPEEAKKVELTSVGVANAQPQKEGLRAFMDTIIACVQELRTLNIVTVIGGSWDSAGKQINIKPEDKVIATQVDLIGGDITTVFSEDFLKAPYDGVREFHAGREKEAHQIIEANINALRNLAKLIVDLVANDREVPKTTEGNQA
jgi:hypothetical protein